MYFASHAHISTNGSQPYTSYFPRADIYELITPDLLHQVIKGVYKDHLVDWVCKYLEYLHGVAGGARVIDEIDRRWVFEINHWAPFILPPIKQDRACTSLPWSATIQARAKFQPVDWRQLKGSHEGARDNCMPF